MPQGWPSSSSGPERPTSVGSGRRRVWGQAGCGVVGGGRTGGLCASLEPGHRWTWPDAGACPLLHLFPPLQGFLRCRPQLLVGPQVTGSLSLRFPRDGSGTPGCPWEVSETPSPDVHSLEKAGSLEPVSGPSPDQGPSSTLSKLFSKNFKKLEAEVE